MKKIDPSGEIAMIPQEVVPIVGTVAAGCAVARCFEISPETLWMKFHRHAAGSQEIWHRPATNRHTTSQNHPGDMPEGTLRTILNQARI